MAEGQLKQSPINGCRILAGLALVALWHTAPAIASFDAKSACSDLTETRLQLTATDLQDSVLPPDADADEAEASDDPAERIAPTRFLSPGTEVSVSGELEKGPAPLAIEHERPTMNARVPGVSEEELMRYKRLMLRKDI